ncbi:flavin-containing monooxygenase [Pseudomonas spirodelae]|uniref:NAD(P)/FAD-dependent oxidoreductase n=1 Tax=Pseudomonas spirodelae TaxID=3101751 RepID=A0ABU5P794_9PSED|nr:NAD(P)/FAD-dependent oxidoreductase [Pseudomonas sp. T5W1]MBU0901503.1 NAD(P)/FAD-dependent oxidoreductase [Gammaproteobacteria bacterium]MEA1605430.1 NAD(P)/FAD-dependent oxidoreductase [Pseudomonas sp. T5W1]
MHNSTQRPAPLRVLIIGSGFGGLGMAIQLQKAGIEDFLLLEKAAEVGGTWRDNSYPGAACDVPSHLYSFSFEPKTDWSRKFAPQAEIHAYMLHCVTKYQLRPRIRCNAEVASAAFDAAAALWRVTLSNGEELCAEVLISACGQLNQPAYPALPGVEQFTGEAFHSARWRHDLDLTGKRVAVIGTGASAIQFVPQLQPKVAEIKLFQRSPAYVLAKPDRAYKTWELALMRKLPWLQRIDRGLKYLQYEMRGLAFISLPWLMKLMRFTFDRHLNQQISDPQLRAQLQPDYPMGCKRILISNDYFPALAKPNVTVISEAISRVTETAIVTADGREHPCDVLIYGTGFAATDFLAPMQITGLAGLELNQAWQAGAEAYKGISVSGFPNLFILYGPNTNLGHNSIIYMLESQFRYVLGCIDVLRQQDVRYLNVKAAVQQHYNQQIQASSHRTIWEQGCSSWYKTASGKSTNNWPGYTFTYRQQTRAPEINDYDLTR